VEIKKNQSVIIENLSQSEPEQAVAPTVRPTLPRPVPVAPRQPVQPFGLQPNTPPALLSPSLNFLMLSNSPGPRYHPPKPQYRPDMHQPPYYQPVSLQMHIVVFTKLNMGYIS